MIIVEQDDRKNAIIKINAIGFIRYLVGAPGRTRTYDPSLRKTVLFPLSYRSIIGAPGRNRTLVHGLRRPWPESTGGSIINNSDYDFPTFELTPLAYLWLFDQFLIQERTVNLYKNDILDR